MRVTLATWGSFGDLHPYLAIGIGLKARGHDVRLATCSVYREKVESEGLTFFPLRPELPPPAESRALMHRLMDGRDGSRTVIRDTVVPALRDTHADLLAACDGADLLLAHFLLFPAPLIAEKTGLPWLSSTLQPIVFGSVYDPPVPPGHPWLIGRTPPPAWLLQPVAALAKRFVRGWVRDVDRFRAELGLPPGKHPIFEGAHSPRGTLALFSSRFAAPQPDWPPQTIACGFPFYDRLTGGAPPTLPPALSAFLDDGPPPVLFTLGTSAVLTAGSFWDESIAAAQILKRRAILLVGRHPDDQRAPESLPPGIVAVDYAPHSLLMPRCAAIVHQGGVGTTGQALRAGRPQLVVPFAHDQPDHAARIVRMGVGRALTPPQYHAASAAAALSVLLGDPTYAARAAEVGRQIQAEDGVAAACDAIEAALRPSP